MRSERRQRAHTAQFSLQQRFPATPKLRQGRQGLNQSQRQGYCNGLQTQGSPKNGQNQAKYFSNRDSGKLHDHNHAKQKKVLPVQTLKTQIKGELQKMTYRQKLFNIQGLIKKSKELCKIYGYFYVTFAMLLFYPDEQVKLSIWIHPDVRSHRPLHQIKKATLCECELEFISSLRSLLKQIFPTINFGKGKTFISLERHIVDLIKSLESKTKKSFLQNVERYSILDQARPIDSFDTRRLATSSKTIPKFHHFTIQDQECQDEEKQQLFKHKIYQKQTKSTLLESIRSKDSIKDKLRIFSVNNNGGDSPVMKRQRKTSRELNRKSNNEPNLSGKIHYKLSQLSEQPEQIKTPSQKDSTLQQQNQQQNHKKLLLEEFDSLVQVKKQQNSQEQQKVHSINSRPPQRILTDEQKRQMKISLMKRSRLGKHMTTSIQIESQLNNLFGCEDFVLDDFYNKLPEGRAVRNSVLSRVAQEFEDLLF